MGNEMFEEALDAEKRNVALKPDYESEIMGIIRSNISPKVMREDLKDYHENDIANVLPDLNAAERKKLYRVLDVEMLSEIFE